MATFTIIQINGDHVHDYDPEALGRFIQFMCVHPREINDSTYDIAKGVKWIGTTGEPMHADQIKRYWLAKPDWVKD